MTDYSSEEFWKGAPKTSTHWQPPRGEGFSPVFWRVENGVPVEAWVVMGSNDLRHIPKPGYIDDVFGRLIARPAPQWNGDGLPPVGTECEVLNNDLSNAAWEKCTILFSGKHRIVYDSESCSERVGYRDCLQFRPIKTPAQIAADEREAAIEAMIGKIKDHPLKYQSVSHFAQLKIQEDACADLYDAGLRFPKGDDK